MSKFSHIISPKAPEPPTGLITLSPAGHDSAYPQPNKASLQLAPIIDTSNNQAKWVMQWQGPANLVTAMDEAQKLSRYQTPSLSNYPVNALINGMYNETPVTIIHDGIMFRLSQVISANLAITYIGSPTPRSSENGVYTFEGGLIVCDPF